MNRLKYVDVLKAVAITFMVAGHVLGKGAGIENTPYDLLYSSFHMPLFMFLSGLFAYKHIGRFSLDDLWQFAKKKALRIMLPYLVIGGGYTILYQGVAHLLKEGIFGGYWFLPALFEDMLFGFAAFALSRHVMSRIIRNTTVADIVSLLVVWGVLCGCYAVKLPLPYLLHAIKMFPFFMMGHFFASNERFSRWLQGEATIALSLVLYIVTMVMLAGIHLPLNIMAFFAIPVLLSIARQYEEKIPSLLVSVGRYSLEIYIFHWFFLPSLSTVKPWFEAQHSFGVMENGNFTLLFVLSLATALPIISFCIFIAKVLHDNKYTNAAVFGEIRKIAKTA